MQIIYQDEYGVGVYWGPSSYPAGIGDAVIVDNEEYRVKSRVFYPQDDKIIITITENMVMSVQKESADTGRLNTLNNAIIAVSRRQDVSEKKNKTLNGQVASVRQYIKQKNYQDKKDT